MLFSKTNGRFYQGVNTGCGGNASTRTKKLEMLQKAFLQHHQAGILPEFPQNHDPNVMPHDIARGAMLLRCNSLIRGHSAVRMEVIELLINALNFGITPLIPLRGSISASGDLSPLAYLGGLLEGNPNVFVQVKQSGAPSHSDAAVKAISASDALHQAGIKPLQLKAKEALGVMNGTAPSAAASALALHDAHQLAILTQVLTAMATEALCGSVDNYHDFISQCRPHHGQIEVANNIRTFLAQSKLSEHTSPKKQGLVQDRYALRTAPQWIGPILEDLLLANQQITTELNSSTDNPLIDVAGDRFHHGGNFQAASVTSAMEKTKTGLVMLGRLIASQCQEIVNPALNKGLSPNLCFDNPSLSFTCKGVDINMSAYLSELAFLSNSVVSHVQVAELNNQSVNSLALIASRYVAKSVDVLTMMCAAHLYVLCQALDLRALDREFFTEINSPLRTLYEQTWESTSKPVAFIHIENSINEAWHAHNQLDTRERCFQVATDSTNQIFEILIGAGSISLPSDALSKWKMGVQSTLEDVRERTCHRFLIRQTTPDYLGAGTKTMYLWIRQGLRVPLNQGLVDHPDHSDGREKTTIGTNITKIYTAIRAGELVVPLQAATEQIL